MLFPGRRRRDQRGAALVEFALVVPIFILLVMGIIDFANAFNDYNSVRQGVREGARQVVVAEWDIPGCTTGTSAQKAACLTRDRIGLDAANTRVRIKSADYAPGKDVTVCAAYQARSITGMFSGILNSRTLRSEISMRIERIDGDTSMSYTADTDPSGQGWSWC